MKRAFVVSGLLLGAAMSQGCSNNADMTRPSSQLNFGVKAAELDLWREAMFRFQRAVQLNPEDALAHNNLAVAYEGAGDFEKARGAYAEALRLDRSNQYIQKNYSRFMEFYTRNKKRGTDPKGAATQPQVSRPVQPQPTPTPIAAPSPTPIPAPTPPTNRQGGTL